MNILYVCRLRNCIAHNDYILAGMPKHVAGGGGEGNLSFGDLWGDKLIMGNSLPLRAVRSIRRSSSRGGPERERE